MKYVLRYNCTTEEFLKMFSLTIRNLEEKHDELLISALKRMKILSVVDNL